MIIFVGDKPSKKNIDPNIPFVGTQSYKKLLEWIWKMKVNINEVTICNKNDVVNLYIKNYMKNPKVITLGKEATKYVEELTFSFGIKGGLLYTNKLELICENDPVKIPHFVLPHPSGLNRKLNDQKWLNSQLRECKKWLTKTNRAKIRC